MERVDLPITATGDDDTRADAVFAAFYASEVVGQVRGATLIVGSRAAAQDIVHDAFVAVLKRWGELRDPGPYLQRTVVNGCRDALRRRSVADRFVRGHVDRTDLAPVDGELFDALARLRFNHRAAIVLRFYLQLTEQEIAAHLGCRPGSVGPWIRRGLDELAAQLRPDRDTP
jgi:RNA polymerase sigma factor (sigma-70 family)